MSSASVFLLLLCVVPYTTAKPLYREARGLAADADKAKPDLKAKEINIFDSAEAEKKGKILAISMWLDAEI